MGEAKETEMTGLKKVLFSAESSFREWHSIQREIKAISDQAEENLTAIQTALIEYRLFLVGLDYKLSEVDEKVWSVHNQIWLALPRLKKKSFKIPLVFRTKTWLDSFWKSWNALLQEEDQLFELISQAPKEMEFYNNLQIIRQRENEQKNQQAENERKLEAARKSLEEALAETSQNQPIAEQIILGSAVIQYEDVRRSLEKRFSEIEQLRKMDTVQVDDVVTQIYRLKEDVRAAPLLANEIQEAENRFSNLVSMNDGLFGVGRNVIPENEMARTTVMLYEQIPKLWTTGSFEELQLKLQGILKFIDYYQDIVRLELEVTDRRRPGLARSIVPGKGDVNEYASMISIVKSLVNAVDSRDRFMHGHSEQVARIALQTAQKMNLSGSDLERVELAALLHDIGKLSIPESILLKNQPLSTEERRIIEKHPFFGANIIRPVPLLREVAPLIYHHQERWDGKGYPDRLTKNDIPLISGIISIAEAYSVMTTDVSYHDAVTREEAITEVEEEAGKQFNPEIIEAFIETSDEKNSG